MNKAYKILSKAGINYIIQSESKVDIDDLVKRSKEILKQKKVAEDDYKKSVSKIKKSGISKRIKLQSNYLKDDTVKNTIYMAMGILEDILKIPKTTKYMLSIVK